MRLKHIKRKRPKSPLSHGKKTVQLIRIKRKQTISILFRVYTKVVYPKTLKSEQKSKNSRQKGFYPCFVYIVGNEGKPLGKNEYFACPLCGMNKIINSTSRKNKGKATELKWPNLNLEEYLVLQVREGGGKKAGASGNKGRGKAPGSGFHLVESESLTFEETLKNPEYANIIEGMKEQLIRVIKSSIATGLISKEDIEHA